MRILLRLFARPIVKPQLGRWNLAYAPDIVNRKIDQANSDHSICTLAQEPVAEPIVDDYMEPFVFYS